MELPETDKLDEQMKTCSRTNVQMKDVEKMEDLSQNNESRAFCVLRYVEQTDSLLAMVTKLTSALCDSSSKLKVKGMIWGFTASSTIFVQCCKYIAGTKCIPL